MRRVPRKAVHFPCSGGGGAHVAVVGLGAKRTLHSPVQALASAANDRSAAAQRAISILLRLGSRGCSWLPQHAPASRDCACARRARFSFEATASVFVRFASATARACVCASAYGFDFRHRCLQSKDRASTSVGECPVFRTRNARNKARGATIIITRKTRIVIEKPTARSTIQRRRAAPPSLRDGYPHAHSCSLELDGGGRAVVSVEDEGVVDRHVLTNQQLPSAKQRRRYG